MKKKNFYSLWAAALLMIVGGCSEELGEGDDPNDSGNGKGGEAYVSVTISSPSTKAMTKADGEPPKGGEEGDGHEPGSPDETRIHDVTVILYDLTNNTDISNKNLDNAAKQNSNNIVAVGYHEGAYEPNNSDIEEHLGISVKLEVESLGKELQGNKFGLICVTNIGDVLQTAIKSGTIKSVGQLADYFVDASGNAALIGDGDKFVMSTHAMVVNGTDNGKTSFIEIAKGNSKENPAKATAFVERLAAKITVAKKEETFIVEDLNDRVTLTRFTIVNQLKAGSYLLKRVTQNVVDSDIDIPNKDGDIYIGDETPTPNGKATNFVIDPWTRHKDGSFSEITRATDFYSTTGGLIKYEELYANSFTKQGYEKKEGADYDIKQYTKYYADFFKGENSDNIKTFATASDAPTALYTLENTTSVSRQINGYSTGAIFEGTYIPDNWFALKGSSENYAPNTDPVNSSLSNPTTYYVYNEGVYKDLWDVFGYWFNANLPVEEGVTYADLMAKFAPQQTKEEITLTSKEKAALEAIQNNDPTGYLIEVLENPTTVKTFATYYDDVKQAAGSDFGKALQAKGISRYDGGKNYWTYWIRHSNNGNNTVMGVMEFGIVRNNVYQLEVAKISGMGESPYTPTEPGGNDEDMKQYIEVNLYVKDWVIRNNGNIEL